MSASSLLGPVVLLTPRVRTEPVNSRVEKDKQLFSNQAALQIGAVISSDLAAT
jgi:hypothetical protein